MHINPVFIFDCNATKHYISKPQTKNIESNATTKLAPLPVTLTTRTRQPTSYSHAAERARENRKQENCVASNHNTQYTHAAQNTQ